VKQANLHTGKLGEEEAIKFLETLGHRILHRNWKYFRKEIDIISCCNEVLHFTEVKTRTGIGFGSPETAVTSKKIQHIQSVAAAFLEVQPQWKRISFDVLAVELTPDEIKILHFQDLS
jgi:putative endonuclease